MDPADSRPSRFLVAKGLPTLPMKVVEKAWSLEFVDMLDFLPTPRALRIAELGGHSQSSLQGSLVGALNEFHAIQRVPYKFTLFSLFFLHRWGKRVCGVHCFSPS